MLILYLREFTLGKNNSSLLFATEPQFQKSQHKEDAKTSLRVCPDYSEGGILLSCCFEEGILQINSFIRGVVQMNQAGLLEFIIPHYITTLQRYFWHLHFV